MYLSGMALQQHFLEGSRKGKVAFKGKRAVGELGLARLALVAVGMKTVGQTEAFRKRAEGIPGILSFMARALMLANQE